MPNLSQNHRIKILNAYRKVIGLDPIVAEGYCNGDSFVWAYRLIQGPEAFKQHYELIERISEIDTTKMVEYAHSFQEYLGYLKYQKELNQKGHALSGTEIKKIAQEFPGFSSDTLKYTEDYLATIKEEYQKIQDLEQFSQLNIFFQDPEEYVRETRINQENYAKSAAMSLGPDAEDFQLAREFSIGFTFKRNELLSVLSKTIQPNKIISLFGPTHVISLVFDGEKYHLFDPNSKTGEIQSSSLEEIVDQIHPLLVFNRGNITHIERDLYPIGIHITGEINSPKHKYPTQKELIDDIIKKRKKGTSSKTKPTVVELFSPTVSLNNSIPTNALFTAAFRSTETAQVILKHYKDPNITLNDSSLVKILASNDDPSLAEALMAHGANLTYHDKRPVLFTAAATDNVDLAKIIVARGFDPSHVFEDDTAAVVAAINGSTAFLKFLFKNDPKLLEYRHADKGWSVMQTTARHGHVNTMRYLLKVKGAALINQEDNEGTTTLMYAAYSDNPEAISFLVQHGADYQAKNKNGWNALMFAASVGQKDIFAELLHIHVAGSGHALGSKAALHLKQNFLALKNNQGKSALDLAFEYKKFPIIHYCLEHQLFQDKTHFLQQCLQFLSPDELRLIFQQNQWIQNALKKNFNFYLKVAVAHNHSEVFEFLLESQNPSQDIGILFKQFEKDIALHDAQTLLKHFLASSEIEKAEKEIFKQSMVPVANDHASLKVINEILGTTKPTPYIGCLQEKTKVKTLFEDSVKQGLAHIVTHLYKIHSHQPDNFAALLTVIIKNKDVRMLELFCNLYKEKVDMAKIADEHPFLLAHAIHHQCHALAKQLILSGCDLNTQSSIEDVMRAPLNLAVEQQNKALVELLLKQGAGPNMTDDDMSVVNLAAELGNIELIELLDRHGAEFDFRDRGNTPLAWALGQGNTEVVDFLIHKKKVKLTSTSINGTNELYLACRAPHIPAIQYLMKIHPELQDKRVLHCDQNTAIHKALFNKNTKVAKTMIALAKPDALLVKNQEGLTPLVIVINGHQNSELALDIIHKNPSTLTQRYDSSSMLELSILFGLEELALEIIKKAPETISFENQHGYNALLVAALKNNLTLAKAICKANPTSILHKSHSGKGLAHIAINNRNVGMLALAIQNEPNVLISTPNLFSFAIGKQPITPSAETLNQYQQIITVMLKHVPMTQLNEDGETALVTSMCYDDRWTTDAIFSALKSLPPKKIQNIINQQDHDGYVAIHLAINRGYEDLALELIHMGADCTINHPDGHTILEMAKANDMTKLVELIPSKQESKPEKLSKTKSRMMTYKKMTTDHAEWSKQENSAKNTGPQPKKPS